MDFKVSVIIPVYNAAKYVSQAVASALEQAGTAEVILVEDGSPDESLTVCHELAGKHESVRLFQHPDGRNRGAGPSRNLGMRKSRFDYMAFLDADDFYLPTRFSVPGQVFANNPDCDGVYEAVGAHFEDKAGQERWQASNMAAVRLTCLNRPVAPEDLFRVLIKGGSGHIHLNGLVIKRAVLQRSGMMNEAIADTLHEDTDFILKLAAVGRLLPGRIDAPTAMRRVHSENRVSAPRSAKHIFRDRIRLRIATYHWCKQQGFKQHQYLVFKRMLGDFVREKPTRNKVLQKAAGLSVADALKLLSWPFETPEVVFENLYWYELGSALWGVVRNDIFKWREK